MPSIFDEASKATEEMFENQAEPEALEDTASEEIPEDTSGSDEVSEEPLPAETIAEEVPAEEEPPVTPETAPEQTTLDAATQTAEIAAQVASEKDAELQQVKQQLEAERLRSAQLQGTIDAMSQQNEEEIIEEALLPPELDISSLAFADEETIKNAQAKYAQDMAEYNRKSMEKEFAPVIEMAKKAKYAEEKEEALDVLSHVKELDGIRGMIPQLDWIIANNKLLSASDVPLEEKYITAYAIARGVNAINTPPPAEPKDPTAEELMVLYEKNPEFQELIERKRIDQVKQHQQVPPFSASSGAVNAALDIPEEPKGWDDASERTRKMFGLG